MLLQTRIHKKSDQVAISRKKDTCETGWNSHIHSKWRIQRTGCLYDYNHCMSKTSWSTSLCTKQGKMRYPGDNLLWNGKFKFCLAKHVTNQTVNDGVAHSKNPKKVRISRDLWPWPWAHPGCRLTWRPSCASLVAIRPFACEKKRFAQKFADRRRTPCHCISSFLEWAKNCTAAVLFFFLFCITFTLEFIRTVTWGLVNKSVALSSRVSQLVSCHAFYLT